jgi:hypothetical protein
MKYRSTLLPIVCSVVVAGCSAGATRNPPASAGTDAGASPAVGDAPVSPVGNGTDLDAQPSDPRPRYYDVPPRVAPPSAPDVAVFNTKACMALKTGPYLPVTPSVDYSYMAPPVKNDDQAYRLAILANKLGHVSFVAPADAQYVIFTSTTIPLTVTAIDGTFVQVETAASLIAECMEVKGRSTYRLKAGTYVFRFGPQSVPNVDVVVSTGVP